jgi:hypothetical protein
MPTATAEVAATAFPLMLVLGFTTNVGFVNFHIANHFAEFDISESGANLIAHKMGSFIGTETHDAVDLQSADAFLASEHHMHDAEPIPERLVGILEDRANQNGEAIAYTIRRAPIAIPVKELAMLMDVGIAATRAYNAFRPAILNQIRLASLFIREKLLEFGYIHLVGFFALLMAVSCMLEMLDRENATLSSSG